MSNIKKLKGKREGKKPTKSQIQNEYTDALKGLQVQGQMTATLIRQLMDNGRRMDIDIGNIINTLNDIQYRALALIELTAVDKDILDKKADEIKLKDFNDRSEKENKINNYIKTDEIANGTIVTISSTTPEVNGDDMGIFRSKFKIGTSGQPLVEKALIGKKVGEIVECEINKIKHVITILDIRKIESQPESKK